MGKITIEFNHNIGDRIDIYNVGTGIIKAFKFDGDGIKYLFQIVNTKTHYHKTSWLRNLLNKIDNQECIIEEFTIKNKEDEKYVIFETWVEARYLEK